jgi:predicted RNA binding protein YcfA (HicA-like mRNA interferase family)
MAALIWGARRGAKPSAVRLDIAITYAHSMRMRVREVLRALEAAGWYRVPSKGGHLQFRHAERPGRVTVPVHGGADIGIGTLRAIERQSGLVLRRRE